MNERKTLLKENPVQTVEQKNVLKYVEYESPDGVVPCPVGSERETRAKLQSRGAVVWLPTSEKKKQSQLAVDGFGVSEMCRVGTGLPESSK